MLKDSKHKREKIKKANKMEELVNQAAKQEELENMINMMAQPQNTGSIPFGLPTIALTRRSLDT